MPSEHVYNFATKRDRHFDPNFTKHVEAIERAIKQHLKLTQLSMGRWSAPARDYPNTYEVTLLECTCPGYAYTGYCKHLALARHIGMIEGLISKCPTCDLMLINYPPMTADEWMALHDQ